MDKKIAISVFLAVAVIGAGLIWWSIKGGKNNPAGGQFNTNLQEGAANQNGKNARGMGSRTGNNNFAAARGEIINKDDTSITLKLEDGGSKIAFYSINTKVSKIEDAKASDLAVGQMILITGKKNDGGTVEAVSVQIRPVGDELMTNRPTVTSQGKQTQGSVRQASGGQGAIPGGNQTDSRDFTGGTIVAIDGKSVTVKMNDETTKSITITDGTKYVKISTGQASDLAVGQNISVSGANNSDGSINSRLIQIILTADTNMMGIPMGGGTPAGTVLPANNEEQPTK